MDLNQLFQSFENQYGAGKPDGFFAPGRVNLIGEHTDYNGGYVLPCALSFGTYLLIRRNEDGKFRFSTTNFEYKSTVVPEQLSVKQGNEWVNYPLGVINQFIKRGFSIPGFDLLYEGDIPNGAGLSSSASIELVTAVALNELLDLGLERLELVKMGQSAENEFVGMNCGIMDQFAVGMGKANSAIFLNCRTLEYELVNMKIDGYSIVVSNTNKRRELAESKYNERVAECSKALELLRSARPLTDLSDLQLDEFNSLSHLIPDETIRKRARHVISENNRVLKAVEALKSQDLFALGQFMNQSHISLRDDYEVTGRELDAIVEAAWKVKGVLGSRMTGAGFGGCSVSIVKTDDVDTFIHEVGRNYEMMTGLKADFYIASLGNGAGKLNA